MIKTFIIAFLTLLFTTSARATGWSHQWINAGDSCRESQIWFVKSLSLQKIVSRAFVDAASNGRIQIYANGYNVTTSVLSPYHDTDKTLGSLHCEVTPFITDTICHLKVWYSPFLADYPDRQLSLTIYGTYTDGTTFAFACDDSWSWTSVDATTSINTTETETIAPIDMSLLYTDLPMPQLLPVAINHTRDAISHFEPQYIRHIHQCQLVDSTATSLTYLAPRPFKGWTRVTMRGMRRGVTVSIDGLNYICSGNTDEQACRRFTIQRDKKQTVKILSTSGISKSNIMSVEAIEIWCEEIMYTKKRRQVSLSRLPPFGRDEATRTPDPYVPNVVRYQLRYIPPFFQCGCKGTQFF